MAESTRQLHELPAGCRSRRQYADGYKYPLPRQEDNALPGYRGQNRPED